MDCLQAREIISEAFDRGVAEVPRAAEAREHCRGCVECRRFVEGLAVLRKTPSPTAPPELVETIVERGRRMAEAGVPQAVPQVVEAVPAEDEPVDAAAAPPPPPRAHPAWTSRAIVAGVAVAAALFAVVLSFQGFRALRPSSTATGTTAAEPSPRQSSAPPPPADSLQKGAPMASVAEGAVRTLGGPRFIALAEETYTWIGVRTPDEATLVPVDTDVRSSLDSSAAPSMRKAWRSKTDADLIFLRSEETSATYLAFRRVLRTFGGKLYALWGAEVTAYGQWPALPSQFSTPTAEDGSPTFVSAGKDDSGLEIFAPQGASPDAGFAVGPGTTPGDPAAGDPNWTWWLPKR